MDKEKKVLLMPMSVYNRLIDDFMMIYSFFRYIIHIIQRGVDDHNEMRKLLAICEQYNPLAETAYRRWNILPDNKHDVQHFLVMQEGGVPGSAESPVQVLSESVESLSAQLFDARASVEGSASYLSRIMCGIDQLLAVLDEQDWPMPGNPNGARQ